MKNRDSEEKNNKVPTLHWKDILAMIIATFLTLLPLLLIPIIAIIVLLLLLR